MEKKYELVVEKDLGRKKKLMIEMGQRKYSKVGKDRRKREREGKQLGERLEKEKNTKPERN